MPGESSDFLLKNFLRNEDKILIAVNAENNLLFRKEIIEKSVWICYNVFSKKLSRYFFKMTLRNKNLLRTFVRAFALILVLSMFLVGCEEEAPKKNFPDFNANDVGSNGGANNAGNIKPNAQPGNQSSGNNNGGVNNNSGNSNSSSGKKRVAITYDDGPHNVRTKAIVDELSKYGFNATFFVVGNRVDGKAYNGAEAVQYAASKGNEIAIHAYTHNKYYDTCSNSDYQDEIGNTYDAIKDVVPTAKVKLMRPVGGRITEERTKACDYAVIMWSVDSNDWKYKNEGEDGVKTIVNNVMSQVQDGSIILMHDIYENTYLASKEILKQLDAQGYEVVTVSELLGNPRAGVKYSKAS